MNSAQNLNRIPLFSFCKREGGEAPYQAPNFLSQALAGASVWLGQERGKELDRVPIPNWEPLPGSDALSQMGAPSPHRRSRIESLARLGSSSFTTCARVRAGILFFEETFNGLNPQDHHLSSFRPLPHSNYCNN